MLSASTAKDGSELKQIQSGETRSALTDRDPVVSVANYFFDSMAMDASYINDGRLHESLVTGTL